jgi:RimJ/RimL family protein N-acetyltransferase
VKRRPLAVKNVLLRPTTTADLDFVLAAESAAENREFILPWPRDQHLAAINSTASAHRIVEDETSGQPVGYLILLGLGGIHRSIEFRRVVVTAKGCGYGRAAVRMVKTFAFAELAAHRLWLDVKEFNHRARRLYESEGFTVEGLLRECCLGQTGFESLYVMSILESQFRRG